MTAGNRAPRCVALVVGVLLVFSVSASSAPDGAAPDFTRLVVLGDGFAAGEANGTLFDGQNAPVPVDLGQQESFAAHLGAAMGTPVVFPRIEYPGIAGKNQLLLLPGFCEFDEDAFDFLQGVGSRVDPFEIPNVLAVPRQRVQDALERRWSINPLDLGTTVDSVEDFLLGFPGGLVGAPPASQIETAVAQQPTFAVVWLGFEDVLGAAREGNTTDITRPRDFRGHVDDALQALEDAGARVAIANVPDPTVLPYFMPQRELKRRLKAEAAPDDLEVTDDGMVVLLGVRRRGFVTRTFQTFATIDGIADGFHPGPLAGTQRLDPREVRRIRRAVRRYNRIIARAAQVRGAVLVDLHSLFRQMHRDGVVVGGIRVTSAYLGGLFGLDGIHLSNTGHALVAQAFVDAINEQCGTSLAGPDLAAVAAADPLAVCAQIGIPKDERR